MGATRRQMLGKVQLPLARRMLLLGVNQTILFALSMVVIAGLIGGGGLGAVVTSGLYTNPALAILGGIAIVIMAMALDRATEAVANRTDPAKRHLDDSARKRLRLYSPRRRRDQRCRRRRCEARAACPGSIRTRLPEAGRATIQAWLLTQIQSVLDYVQDPDIVGVPHHRADRELPAHEGAAPVAGISSIGTPWFVTVGGLTLIAYLISGLRPAITTFLMLAWIGVMGVWALAMDTLSQVLVATVLAVVIGVALGVWAAESNAVSKTLRPINDVLQTLPQLVYIIPFIYLMPVSIVPGIIAGVLYAFPVVVRLVERGVRDVAPEAVEAAGAFGATRRQILTKVKIPLAGDAIMLGVNQGIVMVLAVVVIGGLVGSGGLGLRGRAGTRAGPVRTGCDRVARDPRARHRARSRHPGHTAGTEAAASIEHFTSELRSTHNQGGSDEASSRDEARPPRGAVDRGARRARRGLRARSREEQLAPRPAARSR